MKHRRVTSVIIGLSVLLVCHGQVMALTGVASKITQVSNGQLVRISGRHAPGSEIIVVDQSAQVVAAALDDGSGLFDFNFRVDSNQLGRLQVFAVDQASQTNAVPIVATNQTNMLLPPTLVEDPDTIVFKDRVGIGGYTYPNATVSITLANSQLPNQTVTETADFEGAWLTQFDNLTPGTYTVTAESSLSSISSQASIPLTIVVEADSVIVQAIPKPVGEVADKVGQAVKDAAKVVLPEPVSKVVEDVAPQAKQVAETAAPVASAGLLTQLLLAGRDIIYILIQAVISGLQYFGFWRKKHPWGIVYDAITKQPIMLATVRLYSVPNAVGSVRRLMETDVSSKAGVFSFEPEPGNYQIQVTKPGYSFPSRIILGQTDGEYAHVYHGEQVHLDQQLGSVDVSVPLDPEGIEQLTLRQRVTQFIRQRLYLFTITLLAIGFFMSLIAVIGGAGGVNIILVMFYASILGAQWYTYNRKKKSWGQVVDQKGRPVAGVQLNLIDPQFNKLVQRRVTTQEGKYQFVVPAGKYVIQIENVGIELVKGRKNTYQGQEIWVEGDKPKLITSKIIVEQVPPNPANS